ncbi:MAG: CHRD domain-containing protein [Oricola sp.]|nr:CHRD domain-containing protein [Oricola sp.]
MAKIVAALALLAAAFTPLASANAAVFTGTFSGANEAPPSASSGTGEAVVTFDDIAQTLLVEISFSGLTGTTTGAHLHCCVAPGANAPVAIQAPTLAGFPLGVTAGVYSMSFDLTVAATYTPTFITTYGGGTVPGAAAAFIAALTSGLVYANIHTTFSPGGEIRADLSAVDAAVPLPAALWLFLAGGGALAAASARRRA